MYHAKIRIRRTRRYFQRACPSRTVPAHTPRRTRSRQIYNVRHKMKTIEKVSSIIIAIVAGVALFAELTYVRTGDTVTSLASAITFSPFLLGPLLVAAFRPTTSRAKYYSVAVLTAASPITNLLFVAALILSVLPQRDLKCTNEIEGKAELAERAMKVWETTKLIAGIIVLISVIVFGVRAILAKLE